MTLFSSSLLVFAATQVATPGPANIALMAVGAGYGFARAIPFMIGVVLGKQAIIWPIGFGLLQIAETAPTLFGVLKYASIAYLFWLAWKIATMRIGDVRDASQVPGFFYGFVIHPLNPKAWAMIVAIFTNFVSPNADALQATLMVATCLFAVQLVFHPIWTFAGGQLARAVKGTSMERILMVAMSVLMVLSVFYAVFTAGVSR